MLLASYRLEIFNSERNPGAMAVHCFAHLKREINEAWEKRDQIVPSAQDAPRPQLIEILKLLPKTNCRKRGEPTCMVFATRLAEGAKGIDACQPLEAEQRRKLENYLSRFNLVE